MTSGLAAYVTAHQSDLFTLLEEMVLIQSGSYNKAGIDTVAALISRTCASLPVTIETIRQPDFGNHLILRTRTGGRRLLIVGHMDTVFPEDTAFNWFKSDESNCYGPGVADMKGGLVAGIFGLKALSACGRLADLPLTFVFNADEEIGSPGSRNLIQAQARESLAAFVLECGGPTGEVATGRKGNLSLLLTVKGRAGHAAFAGPDKASAVLELAHKTIALEALNDVQVGLSVNVGSVTAGIGPNTVAESALAGVDCRFITPGQKENLEHRIRDIVSRNTLPGTRSAIEIVSGRPPMPRNEKNETLYGIVKRVGVTLGQTIGEEYRQGVSDANLIAAENVPVIDGLGPIGGNDHSDAEYMVKDSLAQRTLLLAHSLVATHRHYAA